ncbi:hypothetical protein L7F22_008184 [Adiantum nelumboides]|nr:hypothetical protein [Adiantum nelumboides]
MHRVLEGGCSPLISTKHIVRCGDNAGGTDSVAAVPFHFRGGGHKGANFCLKGKDIEGVVRGAVLPKFYADDIHRESWRVFSSCCFNRCVVTANARIMVEFFCKNHLGADKVLGSEIQVIKGGRATALLLSPRVLLGYRKSLPGYFVFIYRLQDAFMVPPRSSAEAVPMHKLFKHVAFHDSKPLQRPTPAVALMTLIWFLFGIVICLICMLICMNTPLSLVSAMYKLLGMKLTVRGSVPEAPETGRGQGVLFVCCHRTCLDPVFLSVALGKQVTAVTYSVSRLTEVYLRFPR